MDFHVFVSVGAGITKNARIDFNIAERFTITSERKKFWFRPQTKSSKVLLTVLSCLIMSNFWFIGHHHLTLFTMKGKMLMMTFEGKNLSIFSHYLPNGGYNSQIFSVAITIKYWA